MKKIILGTLIVALATAGIQTARANDTSWAVVGKVLTGVAVVGLVANAVDAHAPCTVAYGYAPVCPSPAVVYAPAPSVVIAPAPVVCVPRVVFAPVVVRRPVVVWRPTVVVRRGWGCR